MTDLEIESHTFTYGSIEMGLNEVNYRLHDLRLSLKYKLATKGSNQEMKSLTAAEERGATRYQLYDDALFCKLPRHYARYTMVKTALGWLHLCCSKSMDVPQLESTYKEPSAEEIEQSYENKRIELEILQGYLQRRSVIRGNATRLAKAEAAKLYALTPEGLLATAEKIEKSKAKADARKEETVARKLLKALERELTMSPAQVTISRRKAATKARCNARKQQAIASP